MCFSANKILFIDAKLIQIMMYFIFLQALQIHQFTGKRDFLWFASFSRDIVVLRIDAIEVFHKGLLNTGALLVDGVLGGIGDVANAATNIHFHISVGNPLVDIKQFGIVVAKLLEGNAFWMFQEKDKDSLGERRHGDFHVMIVREEDPIVFVDDHTAECWFLLYQITHQV